MNDGGEPKSMEQNGIKNASLRLWEAIEKTFAEHTGFLFLLFFFNYFTMAWSLALKGELALLVSCGLALFFCFVLLTAALRRFLSDAWLSRVKTAFLAVSFLFFVVESFVMHTYQALIGACIVNSVLETNRKEAVEFLQMYVTWRELAAVFAGSVVILGAWRYLR